MPTTRPLPLLALAAALAACGGDGPAPSARSLDGDYTLVRTQRGPLPALLGERENCRYSAVGGSVRMEEGSRFEAKLQRQISCIPLVTKVLPPKMEVDTMVDLGTGVYEMAGDTVIFRTEAGVGTGLGFLRGDTLVVRGAGQTLYYRRERGS